MSMKGGSNVSTVLLEYCLFLLILHQENISMKGGSNVYPQSCYSVVCFY